MPRTLTLLRGHFAVVQLPPSHPLPELSGEFLSITRTAEELSLVLAEPFTIPNAKVEPGWRALKLEGPIPFGETGVLHSLLGPLAEEKISIFAVSTYDTDYVLVKHADLLRAIAALRAHGCEVHGLEVPGH